MWRAKTPQGELPEKSLYSYHYPHSISSDKRNWNQGFRQVISIDPGRKNYAFRIERRYDDGRIIPIVFDKTEIESITTTDDVTVVDTYKVLTGFLDKYKQFYDDCHYVIIEKQMHFNYKAVRISQHTISYFSLVLFNKPLLPAIIEIDSKLKGKMLEAPKGEDLKKWAVLKAREMFEAREDQFSIGVLDYFRSKQDDLSDTACQIEAFFLYLKQTGSFV